MPDGAHVVNYASRGELDETFLERVARGEVPGARIVVEQPNPLPEHETLVLELDGKRLHLHKRGQPYFDGRKDKDPMLVDLYMAGLLATLTVEVRALKSSPYDVPELKGLEVGLQREILGLLKQSYPQEKYRALLQQLEAALTPSA